MSRYLFFILRLLVAAAGIAYICYSIQWQDVRNSAGEIVEQGIVTTLKNPRWDLLIYGLLMVGAIYPLQTMRWWLLLRARSIDVPPRRLFRLVMVGAFFNFCMPGMTGGDVVKAFYAAKRSDRRADTVMSIIVDRITGLLGLIILGGVAGILNFHNESVRLVSVIVLAIAGGLIVGSMLYFSNRLRAYVGFDQIIAKLPGNRLIRTVDNAAGAYRHHLGTVTLAIGIGVVNQTVVALATILGGYALGITLPVGILLAVIPVVYLAGALPVTFQGFGVIEALAIPLLATNDHANANQIVGMMVLGRIFQLFYAVLGSTALLKGDIHMYPAVEEDIAEVFEEAVHDDVIHS